MKSNNKPRIRFYGDGNMYYESRNPDKPTKYEVYGLLWFFGVLNIYGYHEWLERTPN